MKMPLRVGSIQVMLLLVIPTLFLAAQDRHRAKKSARISTSRQMAVNHPPPDLAADQFSGNNSDATVNGLLLTLTLAQREFEWKDAVSRLGSVPVAHASVAVKSLQSYVEHPGVFVLRDGQLEQGFTRAVVTPVAFEAKVEVPKALGRIAATVFAHELAHVRGLRDLKQSDLIVKYLEEGTSPATWRARVKWEPSEPDTPESRDILLSQNSLTGLALSCTPRGRLAVARFDPQNEELLAEAKQRAERLLAGCK